VREKKGNGQDKKVTLVGCFFVKPMLKIPNFTHDKIDASALPSQCHLY
jgi:hypothetical protein